MQFPSLRNRLAAALGVLAYTMGSLAGPTMAFHKPQKHLYQAVPAYVASSPAPTMAMPAPAQAYVVQLSVQAPAAQSAAQAAPQAPAAAAQAAAPPGATYQGAIPPSQAVMTLQPAQVAPASSSQATMQYAPQAMPVQVVHIQYAAPAAPVQFVAQAVQVHAAPVQYTAQVAPSLVAVQPMIATPVAIPVQATAPIQLLVPSRHHHLFGGR